MNMTEIERRFRDELRPLHIEYGARLHELFSELLSHGEIPFALIEHRAKDVKSFLEKARQKAYADPLVDIKDQTGVRLIVYYHDDVSRVVDLIKQEFDVDPAHSLDKIEELGVDEFGYRSTHLVLALGKNRRVLPEWRRFIHLTAEVQVRSVLQHAWAAISHKLDYKQASQAPRELRRGLFRLSALLELADQEFAAIRDRSATLSRSYATDIARAALDIPLNLDSLEIYLTTTGEREAWEKTGRSLGMVPSERGSGYADKAGLIEALQLVGITTIAQFDALLKRMHEKGPDRMKDFLAAVRRRGGRFIVDGFNILEVAVYLHHPHLLLEHQDARKYPFVNKFNEEALREVCRALQGA